MKIAKSQQSILGFVLQLMDLLIGNNQASFLEKGIAVASLIHFGMLLSEALIHEAGDWCSLDSGKKDWWVLKDHARIYAVRLDDKVWQVKEGDTTFTYMQSAGRYEVLNLQIEHDDTDDAGMRAYSKHIVHLKLSYPDEGNSEYHWDLHQFTQRQVEGTSTQQVLAESKEDCVIPDHHVPFFIFNPDNLLLNPILEN